MKKFVCTVCGYVHEGDSAPAECPICHAPAEKFKEQSADKTWAAEHVVGVAQGAPEEILQGLRENFQGECSEVGMYLAMARVAHREGYPEIGLYWEKAAYEEAEHAAKFAELLGEVLTDSTKKNLEMRVDAENGATAGKFELAKKAKELNLDAIHDTVHEMARDEARHGKAFEGLLQRCFGQEKVHKSERFEREWGDPFPLFFPSSKGRRYRGPLNVSACGRNRAEQGLLASCAAGWSADRRERGAGAPRLWAR